MNFDKYVYPGTNILKNKHNVKDSEQLEILERNLSLLSADTIRSRGVTGQFDAAHLQAIHKELFGEIYDWAGEFRDVQIYKGGTEFTAPDEIGPELDALCSDIREKNYFRGLSKQTTAYSLADTMCRLNAIHPFREGNGRTQRLFLEQMALNTGYDLDFSRISENDMRNASFAAARNDNRLMRYLFASNMTETGELGPIEAPQRKEIQKQPAESKPAPPARKSFAQRILPPLSIKQKSNDNEFEL